MRCVACSARTLSATAFCKAVPTAVLVKVDRARGNCCTHLLPQIAAAAANDSSSRGGIGSCSSSNNLLKNQRFIDKVREVVRVSCSNKMHPQNHIISCRPQSSGMHASFWQSVTMSDDSRTDMHSRTRAHKYVQIKVKNKKLIYS